VERSEIVRAGLLGDGRGVNGFEIVEPESLRGRHRRPPRDAGTNVGVRASRRDDFAAIKAVALACGQPATDSGADPAYLAHLSAHGRIEVATDLRGEIVGFGASSEAGRASILTDLFVMPEWQGRGVGRAILERLWSAKPGGRLTFSSQDPRALPLYLRFGMKPRWPLLYLSGENDGLEESHLIVRLLSPTEASSAEEVLFGVGRRAEYEYWLRDIDSAGLAIFDRDELVAVAAATPSRIAHLSCSSEMHATDAVLSALAVCKNSAVSVALPGPHPAVPHLLARGFSIDDYDIHMSSDGVVLPTTSAYSPALG
jgi:GNAT superfamily N-acetyltransferase